MSNHRSVGPARGTASETSAHVEGYERGRVGCRFAPVLASLVALASSALTMMPAHAQVQDTSTATAPVTDAAVVEIALARSPALAAIVTELRRAELLEQAEEHRYALTLGFDASATRTASPTLGFNGVNVPVSNVYRGGAELKRHFVWGTDVALRLEVQSQQTQTAFFNPTVQPPAITIFQLGPGYGGLLKFSVNQPILRGAGRDVFYAEREAARVSRVGARSERDKTASQLLLDVLTAYWELHYASRAVDIQRRSLQLAQERRDDAAARVRTGGLAPVELLSFETRIATIQEDLENALGEERRRATELARLTGEPSLARRRAASEQLPPLPAAIAADARERVLSTSFELAQLRSQVELAEVQARTAADALRPRLDATGYVQAQGLGNKDVGPALDQLFTLGAVSAQLGLVYEGPLDDTRYRSERQRAELAIRAGRDRIAATTQRLLAELDNASVRNEVARKRIDLAARTREIASQQLDAETARFKTGTATALQVREAEDQVRNAELRAARAHTDLIESALIIEHLTSRLLERWSRGGKA